MPKEQEAKARSQPNKGLPSVQKHHQVRNREGGRGQTQERECQVAEHGTGARGLALSVCGPGPGSHAPGVSLEQS